jgi:CRISPR-associated protein Csm2
MRIEQIVRNGKSNINNKGNNNVRVEFEKKFKKLIDNNGRLYYFAEIIERKRYSLDNILENNEKSKELKLFVDYLREIVNKEDRLKLNKYFRNNFRNLSEYEEKKEIEYFRQNIIDIDDYDIFFNNVKAYAYILRNNGMTTSQIRNVYSDVLRINNSTDLKKLRPKFAYIAGKNSKAVVKNFMDLLDYIVKSMNDEDGCEQVKSFKNFLEAIVAYMKYFGDKN